MFMHSAVLRARLVVPGYCPPIENGRVVIRKGCIAEVGSWSAMDQGSAAPPLDLGESIIMPGLINAHAHLDFTDLAGQIPPPASFTAWAQNIVKLKSHWTEVDYQRSWRQGAAMLLRHGTTTTVNIDSQACLTANLVPTTPLRIHSYLELIGIRPNQTEAELVRDALAWIEQNALTGGTAGWSPHAPYTTTASLLRTIARLAREKGLRLTMHVAESQDEYNLFRYRRGPLYDWLKDRREMTDCGQNSPVAHLENCGMLSDRLLAAHANYLDSDDISRLARHRISVVHCPRSHHFFHHRPFPFTELSQAGVNICMGTDSLATVASPNGERPELDLFAEMRSLAEIRPDIPPDLILALATRNGARALGLSGLAGELVPQAWADIIVIPYAGPVADAIEAVVHHPHPVSASMIRGAWILPPALK